MTEKKEKKRTAEAGVAPWIGYNEEETMKSQMLALSQVFFFFFFFFLFFSFISGIC